MWGLLLPMRSNVAPLGLSEECYTFGRQGTDYQFTVPAFQQNYDLPDNKYFTIRQTPIQGSDDHIVFLENSRSASARTYVNRSLLNPGQQTPLRHHDEIGLVEESSSVFVYHDFAEDDQTKYPEQLRRKYTFSKKLGKGNFGEVRFAFRPEDSKRCAVKILDRSQKNLEKEINLLQRIKHKCIVQLYDVVYTDQWVFLVMELANEGEMPDKGLPEKVAKLYLYQVCHALCYLHDLGITHRDLKPQNILMNTEGMEKCAMVCDFGLAKLTPNSSLMNTICGTRLYMAPEVMQGGSYTRRVDMWSFGCIVYKCLSGAHPFQRKGDSTTKVLTAIKEARFGFEDAVWEGVSPEAKDLISQLLLKDPDARLKAQQALDHPWFQDEEVRAQAERAMAC